MGNEERNKVLYQLSVAMLERMLGEGLISRKQYQSIDQWNIITFGVSFFDE